MSKIKKILMSLFLVIAFTAVSNLEVNTYVLFNSNYKLLSGVTDRHYYIQPGSEAAEYGGVTVNYSTIIRDAVDKWNISVDGGTEDVNFIETTSRSASVSDFYVAAYDQEWLGLTDHMYNSTTVHTGTGGAIASSWGYFKVFIDTASLNVISSSNNKYGVAPYNFRFGVIGHEFGHGLGLAHSSSVDVLMYGGASIKRYTPATDDISGVRALY